jgi:hypothetical protein
MFMDTLNLFVCSTTAGDIRLILSVLSMNVCRVMSKDEKFELVSLKETNRDLCEL